MSAERDTTQKSQTAQREEEVLAFWNREDIFKKSLEKDAPNGEFVFYDGPPFATGTPHYGHLLQSAIKDTVPRYWTMRGYHVERQWGWDCHGLPIENIVEKEIGTKSKKDIEELGVKKFNDLCREKIFTYADVWDKFVPRFGRWADMSKPYRTLDKDYMESEWWAFKQLYDKGLIYEDYRSMHICPRCETTLAQAEVSEGYQDVKDLSVTAEFRVKGEDPRTSFLAWTTTPWTLPGNVALAVGADIDYVVVEKKDENHGEKVRFVLAKAALERIFGDDEYEVISEAKGSELAGTKYEPLFDSYAGDMSLLKRANGWYVYAADFVTTDTGTGIVHIAPAFGEDDMQLAKQKSLPFVQHVGMDGVIKPEVKELAGLHVKPKGDVQATDVEVVKYLASKGLLFAKEKYEHSYPHCWRCDTPLINYATSSWFVAVEEIKDELLANAEAINWSPAHMKHGRWGEWLKGARDWSISRQRFWANTIPVWRCDKCQSDKVFGSVEELEKASGTEVTDLHKDVVDTVKVACSCGNVMHRVPDVLDTWFDSSTVPFASYHYPFENEDVVAKRIPADFIGEAYDQISKWFYYQHVLGTALFNTHVFKNVITSGIVLAEDGKKMSKRLQNYPDPQHMIDTYGADATRMYMIASPVVRGESLSFSEKGVGELSRKVFGRLVNVYDFYALYKDDIPHEPLAQGGSALDEWIVARLSELHRDVTNAMNEYDLQTAARPFAEFVDDLSTWYLRRSRERFKGSDEADKKHALETTRFALREFARVLAPFAPFHADWLWQRVRTERDEQSVHLASWGAVHEPDEAVLTAMDATRRIVSSALEMRAQAGIKVRQPLAKLTVQTPLTEELLALAADEVNVKQAVVDASIAQEVILDTNLTTELREEGQMREIVREVQDTRKREGFALADTGIATVSGPIATLNATQKFKGEIGAQTNTTIVIGREKDELVVELRK